MAEHSIQAEHIRFEKTTRTVEDACREANCKPDDIVKSICIAGEQTIVALVLGSQRASTERVAKALGIERPNIATPDEVLERTGYLAGGVPPFGYPAIFLIDPAVMEKQLVYAGGGTPNAIIRTSVREILKANDGVVARVRK
ncbi:MAG: hypothetical protein HY517_01360 [Candidatus Aenigmarchaeota archaeon]|nr:hypothetical protein [Candidatus Aenigmarchaeota archaeon]